MSTDLCTGPSSDDEPKNESQRDAGRNANDDYFHRSPGNATPNRDACLEAIAALPGLVAMRILSPAQANSMRATYAELLRNYDRARQGQSAQLADDDVLKLWRDQPQMIDLLHPFLTQQQLELIMREARADERKA